MFRLVYGAGTEKHQQHVRRVKKKICTAGYSDAAMHIAESNVKAILAGEDIGLDAPLKGHQRLCHDDRKPFRGIILCMPPAC